MTRMKTIVACAALILGPAGLVLADPPPAPPYQMRSPAPAGDRLAPGRDGQALFENHCGYCHLTYGMGTNLLVKQRLAVGASPATALLANRDDLTAAYVHAVVRMGKGAMPPQTRVDVTDAELDSVAAYLGRGK
ncbi:cytochrome c [Novosphingobium sp.]|uniref:c-type cytochrome n=1 Tax=Novosphingobium sp. TaxID=1874826 RepID=UPI0033425B16